jgi:hypothetical protein
MVNKMRTRKSHKAPRPAETRAGEESKDVAGATPVQATAEKAKQLASDYAIPGAAVLGSGLAAIAGVLLREQLGRILVSAARGIASGGAAARDVAARELELERLLSHVGLQRRRSSVLGVSLGALAGIAAGSALAMWLGPMVREALATADESKPEREEPTTPQATTEERQATQNGAL